MFAERFPHSSNVQTSLPRSAVHSTMAPVYCSLRPAGPRAGPGGTRPLPQLLFCSCGSAHSASSLASRTRQLDEATLGTPGPGRCRELTHTEALTTGHSQTPLSSFLFSSARGGDSCTDHLLHQHIRASLCARPTLSRGPTGTGTA